MTLAVVATASPVAADVRVTYDQGDTALFSFEVPDFWTLQTGGERVLTAPGETAARAVPQVVTIRPTVEPDVWMGFFSPPGVRSVEEGLDYLSEIGAFLSEKPDVTSKGAGTVGGRAAEIISGTGARDGRDIAFTIAVFDLPGAKIGIAAGVAEIGASEAIVGEMNRIFSSVRVTQ